MGRVVAFSFGALTIMTALLILPPMLDASYFKWAGGPLEKLRLILLLVPQALPLSIPMGICIGVVCAMRARRTSPRHVAAVLAIAAVATFGSGRCSNGECRRRTRRFGRWSSRDSAMVVSSIRAGTERAGTVATLAAHRRACSPALAVLWAICFATGPLALFSLGIAGVVRRFSAAMAVSVTAILLYWAFMASIDEALREGALRGAGAWVGNLPFVLAGVLMLRYGQRIFRLKPEATN